MAVKNKRIHYEESGDNYKIKDPFKIKALQITETTNHNAKRFKKYGIAIKEMPGTRGESAFCLEFSINSSIQFSLATVEEGLGTKNVAADEMAQIYGKSFYYNIGIDNAASILNDLATSGASPLNFMLHIGAYPTEWFTDEEKTLALLEGTADACNQAGAVWGGGESGTLRDIIMPGRALLSGSANGLIIPSDKKLSDKKIKVGDRIILLESKGPNTNGITLLRREVVERLPEGYQTKLPDGTTYGEALLVPTILYSRLVEELVQKTEVHYAQHITGHGWRKMMRSNREFTYLMHTLPSPPPIFDLIKEVTLSSDYDMYDTHNMGAGFALFVPEKSVSQVLKLANKAGICAIEAGVVQKGKRQVIIDPLNITFKEESLLIR